MKVYLDDRREAPAGWTLVRSPRELIDLLEAGEVDEVSLDHDLGLVDEEGREVAGYDVLLYIEQALVEGSASFCIPEIQIHSANVSAYKRMELARASIYRLAGKDTPDS
jgi:hypothetical protein